ncbi:MAG: serine/threonine protein kinase, partial [Actinomycetota bacterium]|nr:serine/threonine protein kinase [Actinomycetota bacterium]
MQAELRPGDRIAGCVVESELGRGGMGVVYRARQESLQRTVAVKVISPALAGDAGFARRFQREARLAASIEHPSVVPIHAAGEEDGRLYLVMRFVDGTDLFNEVASHGPLVPQRVARLAGELAGALDAVHARGLVHRDVKPANALLSGSGENEHALLTDFGADQGGGRAVGPDGHRAAPGHAGLRRAPTARRARARRAHRHLRAGLSALRVPHGPPAVRGHPGGQDVRAPPHATARRRGPGSGARG